MIKVDFGYFYNENERDVMLANPLHWIQIVQFKEIFRIEAIYRDFSYRTAAIFDKQIDEEWKKYRKFKRYYLALNKIKFGELVKYELSHL